ncbi:sensor histidine kinase [Pedobacter caeni]|uniref:histidine kinase n=1 Tax=Pedobacter caeni TaxID=288992 RepID=A0A1M5JMB3_9SPHI|nr:sensor histidine kinase [Pedobacter caeni]SHG41716.1 Histidine kinase [Pedobacter caeni]
MKRIIFLIAFFASFQPLVYAQGPGKIDSLTKVLKAAKTDTARISTQNKMVKAYLMQRDSVNAYAFAYKSLAMAKRTPSIYHKAYTDQILGYINTVLMHTDSCIFYNKRVLSRLKNQTDLESLKLVIYATNNLSSAYANSGFIKKSAELLISNLPRLEKTKEVWAYEVTIQNIASCFSNLGEYSKSYPYMLKAVEIAEQKEKKPEAKLSPYLTGAILMYRMDSISRMGEYLIKTKKCIDEIALPTPFTARYYAYQACYFARSGKPKEADQMLSNAEKELKEFGSRTNQYDIYFAKNIVALTRKDYRQARDAAMGTYKLGIEDQHGDMILSGSKDVAYFSELLGDHKTAYQYLKKYSTYGDSVKLEQTVREVHDLETKYQTSEKEKQITLLQAEKQQALLKNKNQRLLNLLWAIGTGVLLLVIAFLVYFYRNSKKRAAQQFREIEQEQELKLARAMLEGEERERTRLARDLHDGLGGTLSGIKFKLSSERKPETPIINEVIIHLDDSIEELRRIARNMMPESLLRSGLETALQDLCSSLSDDKRKIAFLANGISKSLTLASQVNIYRIIQELLSNAIRHSEATEILVQCIQDDQKFLITVEDNGKGFDTDATQKTKGIGLNNIYNRVNYVKGKLDIRSVMGEGTSVNIELDV